MLSSPRRRRPTRTLCFWCFSLIGNLNTTIWSRFCKREFSFRQILAGGTDDEILLPWTGRVHRWQRTRSGFYSHSLRLIQYLSHLLQSISFRTIPGLVDMLTDAKLASPLHQVPKMRKPAEMMIIIMIPEMIIRNLFQTVIGHLYAGARAYPYVLTQRCNNVSFSQVVCSPSGNLEFGDILFCFRSLEETISVLQQLTSSHAFSGDMPISWGVDQYSLTFFKGRLCENRLLWRTVLDQVFLCCQLRNHNFFGVFL